MARYPIINGKESNKKWERILASVIEAYCYYRCINVPGSCVSSYRSFTNAELA